MPTTTPTDLLDRLRTGIRGAVIGPDDSEYDEMRAVVMGGVDPRPGAIARVLDAADVAHAIAIARETGAEIAVRSGGHSGAAHGTTDGGIVIDVRELKALEVDESSQTAWAGSGLTAGEVSTALAERGLAVGFGDTGSVGIGGITLGGGVGFLVRKHGLTIDNLLAAEIVTADGRTVVTDADTEPDLFWAIRGGGGNFGVATRFQYRLAELPSVVGGTLVLPATAETIAGFMSAADAAPDELSSIANVMNCPPMPFVPEEYHGTVVILASMIFAGPEADAGHAYAPFHALAEPIADLIKPMAYPEIFPPEEFDADSHPTAVATTMFLDRVDVSTAATIVRFLESSDASLRAAQLRPLGGAAARVPVDATAYAHRASRVMVNLAAFYEGEEDRVVRQAWLDEFADAIRQTDRGAYVNFVGDEGADRVRDAYPGATWDRLASIKARYDPTNLFHRNQNVPPVVG